MGKKRLKRKLNKHDKVIDQVSNGSENQVKNFVYILGSILLVVGVLYFILSLTMKEPKEVIDNTPTVEEKMQDDKILGQDLLKQDSSDYVVFYVNGDEGLDELDRYYDAFVSGKTQLPVFVVDLNESVNSRYLVDDSELVEKYGKFAAEAVEYEKDPKKLKEVEVYNFPTVIRVTDGKINGYHENESIFDVLGLNEENQQF